MSFWADNCHYKQYRPGYRTYGDNIPGYAQGAYFPGDEPGWFCKASECLCPLEDAGDSPELCDIQEEFDGVCPDCDCQLMRNGAGVVYCKGCGRVIAYLGKNGEDA